MIDPIVRDVAGAGLNIAQPAVNIYQGVENLARPSGHAVAPALPPVRQAIQQRFPATSAPGEFAGAVAALPAYLYPPVAVQALGGGAEADVEAQRAAGHPVSTGAEAADVAGQAGLAAIPGSSLLREGAGAAAKLVETLAKGAAFQELSNKLSENLVGTNPDEAKSVATSVLAFGLMHALGAINGRQPVHAGGADTNVAPDVQQGQEAGGPGNRPVGQGSQTGVAVNATLPGGPPEQPGPIGPVGGPGGEQRQGGAAQPSGGGAEPGRGVPRGATQYLFLHNLPKGPAAPAAFHALQNNGPASKLNKRQQPGPLLS